MKISSQTYQTFFHRYQGSIDFNTVNIHRTVGMYFLVSTGNSMILNVLIFRDQNIQYTPCSRECTDTILPLGTVFPLGPQESLGPRFAKSPPLENLLGLGGCIIQYIPPLGSVRIQYS